MGFHASVIKLGNKLTAYDMGPHAGNENLEAEHNKEFQIGEIEHFYDNAKDGEKKTINPQAIVCFLESADFEDAIRNAVSLGGDGDTIAAIAGSIAEGYYGIPCELEEKIFDYFDDVIIDYFNVGSDAVYGELD